MTRALEDRERGLGERGKSLAPDALELIARLAQGDARRALGLLESAVDRAPAERIERDDVAAAFEARVPDYDKGGEAHYDVISAFIKSLRGSDPDAAVYWLARMLGGRRGAALHPAAPDDLRVGGRRQRGPAAASWSRPRRPRRSTGSACPRAS